MLPNIGSGELILIAVIALIVIRPKELPAVLRTVGKSFAALKRMANQFRGEFNKALQETELENVRQDLTRHTQSIKDEAKTFTNLTETNITPNTINNDNHSIEKHEKDSVTTNKDNDS